MSGPACGSVVECCRLESREALLIFNLFGVVREGQSVSGRAFGLVVERRRPVSRAAVVVIFNLLGTAREGLSISGPACGSAAECCRPASRAAVLIFNMLGVAREGQSMSGLKNLEWKRWCAVKD